MNYLLAATALGIVHILAAAGAVTMKRGVAYNVSARDEIKPPLTGVPGRLERASHNFMETFPFFAAAVLVLNFLGKQSPHADLASQIYFYSRVIYLPLYVLGIPYLRTVTWTVSLVGIIWLIVLGLG